FDEHQVVWTNVLNPVRRAAGDIDGLPGPEFETPTVKGHQSEASNDEPVLRSASMPLVAEATLRPDEDLLDLVVGLIEKDVIVPPGSIIPLERHRRSLLSRLPQMHALRDLSVVIAPMRERWS